MVRDGKGVAIRLLEQPVVPQTSMVRSMRYSVVAFGGLAVAGQLALIVDAGVHHASDYADPAVLVPVFWLAGAIAYSYRPRQRCAQLLMLAGTLIAVSHALATLPAVVPHGAGWWPANLASRVLFAVGFAAWGAAMALLPDGTVETRVERLFTRVVPVLAATVPVLGFFSEPRVELFGIQTQPSTPVPLWSHALAPFRVVTPGLFAAPLLGVVLLTLRHRRADAQRRSQLRWPLRAAAVAAAAIVTSAPVAWAVGATAQSYLFVVAVATLPVAIMLGMVRERLFDLDRLVLRSLGYAALWAGIAAGGGGVALLLGLAAGRTVAIGPAIAVAVVAIIVLQPIRSRLERIADRWVYGERLSGHEAMRRLGAALEHAGDGRDLAQVVAATVRRGLRCEWTRVLLSTAGPDSSSYDGPVTPIRPNPELVVPISHAGAAVGSIECGGLRSDGGATAAERELLEDLSRQVAPALHNLNLHRDLAARLEELSASRARLVRAEETERRRIERDLHDGIQAQLVAVAAKVEVARLQRGFDSPDLDETLDELATAIHVAQIDLRELVRGIHPAALEDHGLVRAIEDRTAMLPLRVTVEADARTRSDRLPLHIEGAAYFLAIEGITNVIRHAGVSDATVALTRQSGHLHIEVIDDGGGFQAADLGAFRGLRGLTDRLQALGGRVEVTSCPGGGTRLLGVLPVVRSDGSSRG